MYVHKRGNLMTEMRNSLTEIPHVDHIVEASLQIDVHKRISTSATKCSELSETFDSCVESMIYQRHQDKCVFPFWNQIQSSAVCNVSGNNQLSLNIFQTSYHKCVPPCIQVKVEISNNPINWFSFLLMPRLRLKDVIPGYYMSIPASILKSEMQESYSAISFIAEFGGWVGLFLGISLLGLFVNLKDCITKKLFEKVISRCFTFLQLVCTAGVLGILVSCSRKMIVKPTNLDVNIEENLPDIGVSFCSLENVYSIALLQDTNFTYLGNLSSFWNDITKLSEKIDGIELTLGDESTVDIFDSRFSTSSSYIPCTINTPKYGTYIETCHTLDLSNWKNIKTVKVRANKALIVYVHLAGQLLRSRSQGFTFIKDTTVDIAR